jgi:hypothetical protein
MLEFAQKLDWWHWWIAAAVLAAAETFVPGAIAIWFAAAAVVVGALLLIVPVPWQLQLVLFGALGVAAIFLWRRYRFQDGNESDQPALNQRGVSTSARNSRWSRRWPAATARSRSGIPCGWYMGRMPRPARACA